MDRSERIFILSDIEALEDNGAEGYHAIDVTSFCFGELRSDPWETLRALRVLLPKSRLQLTLGGQSLLGYRHYSDEVVDAFVAAAVDNGIDTLKVYDALNDARNLETAARAVKKYGAHLTLGMVYAESPVHSIPYFAGCAAQLASIGADSLCICGMNNEYTCRELTEAAKRSADIPVCVSASTENIASIALDAGADIVELNNVEEVGEALAKETEAVRADAGYSPLAFPISEIIRSQAACNLHSSVRYSKVSEDFKSLILGMFGKPPAPVSEELIKDICGNEPLMLARPADMIKPEYDIFRDYVSPWLEQDEDILTYAIYGRQAIVFFEERKAKKYGIDLPHANPAKGIHIV